MDKYLETDSAYSRLWAEYKKYNSLVVAVDFDDTLFDFHGTGGSYGLVQQLIRDLKTIGCYIIVWTGNSDKVFIVDYMLKYNIPYDTINENPPFYKSESRKIYANVYIDDRAGLKQVYDDLTLLVYKAKKENYENK